MSIPAGVSFCLVEFVSIFFVELPPFPQQVWMKATCSSVFCESEVLSTHVNPTPLNQWYPRISWVDNNFLNSFFHIMGCLQYHWQTNPYQISVFTCCDPRHANAGGNARGVL